MSTPSASVSAQRSTPGDDARRLPVGSAAVAGAQPGLPTWSDIPLQTWQGRPVDCSACPRGALQRSGDCEPGVACVQDAYARRIQRFFQRHPGLADEHLGHPYFEVRAIAVRHAEPFRLPALVDDPDETVRGQLAYRLPLRWLSRLKHDPHREVRLRVALRLPESELAGMLRDPDPEVRRIVARRGADGLLPMLLDDADAQVRCELARRLVMPALWRLVEDPAPEVRRLVAERLPAPLLDALAGDDDFLVRHTVAGRALGATLQRLRGDADADVREASELRWQDLQRHPGAADRHGAVVPAFDPLAAPGAAAARVIAAAASRPAPVRPFNPAPAAGPQPSDAPSTPPETDHG